MVKEGQSRFDGTFLGVLGGMGPLAGAVFVERLVALTDAARDQDHVPTVLWSDPRVPDRTDARLHGGEDPLPWLIHGAIQLKKAGARLIAIPCNSAHLWYDQLTKAVDIRFLHIVQSTVADLKRHGIRDGCIGLMGAAGTLEGGLYQEELKRHGFDCVLPRAEEIEYFCMRPIRLVKANEIEAAYLIAAECIELLKQRGAQAIVLGCTEYPIAVPHARRASLGIPLIDSIDALARAAIEWHSAASSG
ncbi:MAG: amino acid racemase [Polaromonas sp.]